jgi:tRNA (guanine-N7-)-methyltransferase
MKKRIRTHTNPLNIVHRLDTVSICDQFKKYSQIDFEIGFGRGRFLSHYANTHLNRFVIGVEVRKAMVLDFNARYCLPNGVALWGSAQIALEDIIPDATLDRVFVFHPDPWFKKRHHKRRVLNSQLMNLIQKKMNINGCVYVSTDVEELYKDMLNLCHDYGNVEIITDELFWKNEYSTHWSVFSEKDQRQQYFLTFKFKE